ncbi:MAG TPA: nickel pincer cofactor biosynthesis protein LarC [Bacillota bacterium]|nr:nickel pincer cofactor biosynthesis protein LarC [Bacillota bacterium]HPZ14642.1 nickel pincer cofactor biosynthesis protein LarC [Bacillota bacterium]
MMIAYFDCYSGISGDMILGALIDAGLDPDDLLSELSRLEQGGLEHFDLAVSKVLRKGIGGTHVEVITAEAHQKRDREHSHDHHHGHDHDTLFRNLSAIEKLLDGSGLDAEVRETSRAIFRRLAEAEALVHGIPVDRVHFHEVGAIDTVVDVVGAVAGLRIMGVERVFASPIHVGTGLVRCAHGTLPVPAPATAELLRNVPVYATGVRGELATPTGAAIITTLAESFGPIPEISIERIGYGAGRHDFEIPNLLRVLIGKTMQHYSTEDGDAACDLVTVECNIDDMNPEFYEHVMDLLLKRGALDAFVTPVLMKKGRPGHLITVLTPRAALDIVTTTLFEETTTLGVRIQEVSRRTAQREWINVSTEYGVVRVKVARFGDRLVNVAPEYEDCRKLAKEYGVPLKAVYDEVKALARE